MFHIFCGGLLHFLAVFYPVVPGSLCCTESFPSFLRDNVTKGYFLMHVKSPASLALAILAVCSFAALPAHAQTFSFTSGTYSADHLANDGTQGTAFDTMALSSTSGSVTLTTGTPVLANINGVTFNVGLSSTGVYGPISYSGSESFTFNGVTQTLTFPYSATSSTTGTTNPDVLQFTGGNTTIFSEGALGQVTVTPQALKLTSLGGATTGTLQASFLLTPPSVPEASSFVSLGLLLLLGLGGMAVSRRRKGGTVR